MADYSIKTDFGDAPMSDPVAFFLTWVTYGTWLPGDQRGWIEHQHGWKMPQPLLELECKARQEEESCLLSMDERVLVDDQIAETCRFRKWILHAVNCRSNHVHVVVTARDYTGEKVRDQLKANCTRGVRDFDPRFIGRPVWTT